MIQDAIEMTPRHPRSASFPLRTDLGVRKGVRRGRVLMLAHTLKRFNTKVTLGRSGCWNWQGATNAKGYGFFWFNERLQRAHRIAYEHFVGRIPPGCVIHHRCQNPSCVNPEHLSPITNRENVLSGRGPTAHNHRKKRCMRGHWLKGNNIRTETDGKRRCLTCARQRVQQLRSVGVRYLVTHE